ncbi:MAG: hypothetical protein PVJ49_08580 [Acidobacteriota bacterium]|jgi:hypothetical protein
MSIPTLRRRPFSDSSPNQGDSLSRGPRATIDDPFCIVIWKFTVESDDSGEFAALCERSRAVHEEQPKCLFQRLTRKHDAFHVHVGLEDAYGVLAHVTMFADTLKKLGAVSRYRGVEIHGTVEELTKLKDPLGRFRPAYFERDNDALV